MRGGTIGHHCHPAMKDAGWEGEETCGDKTGERVGGGGLSLTVNRPDPRVHVPHKYLFTQSLSILDL